MMAIFDSNIIIDHLRGIPEAKKILEDYSRNEKIGISSITAYELMTSTNTIKEEEGLSLFLLHSIVYPLDFKAVCESASIYKQLRSRGFQLSMADTLILGVAKANDETFVTYDKGFENAYEKLILIRNKDNKK